MIQEATAALASTFTHKFVVKAIIPRLKLASADITDAMSFALQKFDDLRGNYIVISDATESDQTEVTLVVTSPDELTSYNVPLVIFKAGDTELQTFNAHPDWIGYTIAGAGIAAGTTVTDWGARRPLSSGEITLSQLGASLTVRQKYQIRVDTAALGIPWEEGAEYTFEISEGFAIDADTETNFTSPAQTMAYTANPVLALSSTDPSSPVPGDTGTVVNDFIKIKFSRPIQPYVGQNFYFYQYQDGISTLLKTFNTNEITFSNTAAILDVRGLMKESTEYYVLTDEEPVIDADNFVFPGILDDQQFRFTSAVPIEFRGFIAMVMTVGATAALIGVRKRYNVAITATASVIAGTTIRSTLRAAISSAFSVSKANMGKLKTFNAAIVANSNFEAQLYDSVMAVSSAMTTSAKRLRNFLPTAYNGQFSQYVLNTDYFTVDAFTDDLTATNVLFGDTLDFSSSADNQLFIAKGSNNATSYIFSKNSGTWEQEATFATTYNNAVSIEYKSNEPPFNPSFAAIGGNNAILVYERDDGVWTLANSLAKDPTDPGSFPSWLLTRPAGFREKFITAISSSGRIYFYVYLDRFQSGTYVWYRMQVKFSGGEIPNAHNDTDINSIGAFEGTGGASIVYYTDVGNNLIRLNRIATSYNYVDTATVTSSENILLNYTTGDYNAAVVATDRPDNSTWRIAAGLYKNNFASSVPGVVKIVESTSSTGDLTETQSIQAPVPLDNDEFGKSVDLAGDYLAIGAPGAGAGAVYVYKFVGSAFTLDTVLRPEYPITGMRFGESVKISTDGTVAIGASKLNNATGLVDSTGTVFVYNRIPT